MSSILLWLRRKECCWKDSSRVQLSTPPDESIDLIVCFDKSSIAKLRKTSHFLLHVWRNDYNERFYLRRWQIRGRVLITRNYSEQILSWHYSGVSLELASRNRPGLIFSFIRAEKRGRRTSAPLRQRYSFVWCIFEELWKDRQLLREFELISKWLRPSSATFEVSSATSHATLMFFSQSMNLVSLWYFSLGITFSLPNENEAIEMFHFVHPWGNYRVNHSRRSAFPFAGETLWVKPASIFDQLRHPRVLVIYDVMLIWYWAFLSLAMQMEVMPDSFRTIVEVSRRDFEGVSQYRSEERCLAMGCFSPCLSTNRQTFRDAPPFRSVLLSSFFWNLPGKYKSHYLFSSAKEFS